VFFHEMAYALLAPGYCQQFSIELDIPIPAESQFAKSGIERGAMTIALGVCKRSIDVEQDCPQWPILPFSICFQGAPVHDSWLVIDPAWEYHESRHPSLTWNPAPGWQTACFERR
jgi:hypothetical protein